MALFLVLKVRMTRSAGKDSAAPDSEKPKVDKLLHDLNTAASACGITQLGTVAHLSGGRFVLRSDSDGDSESGLVYDVCQLEPDTPNSDSPQCFDSLCPYCSGSA